MHTLVVISDRTQKLCERSEANGGNNKYNRDITQPSGLFSSLERMRTVVWESCLLACLPYASPTPINILLFLSVSESERKNGGRNGRKGRIATAWNCHIKRYAHHLFSHYISFAPHTHTHSHILFVCHMPPNLLLFHNLTSTFSFAHPLTVHTFTHTHPLVYNSRRWVRVKWQRGSLLPINSFTSMPLGKNNLCTKKRLEHSAI